MLLFACVANEDIEAHRDAAEAAKAVILSEGEVARREQLAYYTEKAKEVKAKQDAELEQLKEALQTLGVETEEKEEIANAE